LDVFVLPSLVEGLNTSLLQAMAWELPCIASDVGGVPEAMGHEQEGLLVVPNDPEALASAILQMLTDPERAIHFAKAAREKAVRCFSKARMVAGTVAVYRGLMDPAVKDSSLS